MWVHFALLLLAGTALADTTWKPNYVYNYVVQSRALAGLKSSEQVAGFLYKTNVKISVPREDTLMAEFSNSRRASIHSEMTIAQWDADLSDREVNYETLTTESPSMKVTLHNGQIDQVFVPPNTPMSQVNLAKGILSQLQFYVTPKIHKQLMTPWGNTPNTNMYTTKEQTVSGYCDTTYDVTPLHAHQMKTSTFPVKISTLPSFPDLDVVRADGYLRVTKFKNYQKCRQTPNYHFALMHNVDRNLYQNYVTRSSVSDMVVSHDKAYFTIRSVLMKHVLEVRPTLKDMEASKVFSMMNVTLVGVEKLNDRVVVPTDVLCAGNLTYVHSEKEAMPLEAEPYTLDVDKFIIKSKDSAESIETAGITKGFSNKHENSAESDSRSNSREHGYLIRKRDLNLQQYGEKLSSMEDLEPSHSSDRTFPELVKPANVLIHEIAAEITAPDEISRLCSLEKYTILTNLIRQMNETSLAALENKLQIVHKTIKLNERKVLAWKIFRDAVTQAGTLPAFKTLRTWLLTKKVTGMEAARIIGQLPRVLRKPTMEYIQQFFELIDIPEVKNQKFVNSTAPYAFAELVRYTLVWNRKYSYPSFVFGNTLSRQDEEVVTKTYIPYLAKNLKKAYDEKCGARIIAYTAALGNLAHPEVLKVFEPYLEGKYVLTKFQRTIMVGALVRLNKGNPEVVRNIAYKIYDNKNESYQVRVMAVRLLFGSKPALYMLRLMAIKTFVEPDEQVNNAVITGINDLAELKAPTWQGIARNARIVQKLMKPDFDRSSAASSTITLEDYVNKNKDFITWSDVQTIGSKVNFVPKLQEVSWGTNFSNLVPPAFNLQYGTSNIQLLWKLLKVMFGWSMAATELSTVDELAEKLNLLHDDMEMPEGCFISSSPYGVLLFVFDNHTLQDILHDVLRVYTKAKNDSYDLTAFFNWEFTVSYPSEVGVVLNYGLKAPLLVALKSKVRADINPHDTQVATEIDLLMSQKVINRVGFVTSLDAKKQYFAGVNVDRLMRLPVALTVNVNQKNKKLKVEYKPLPGTEKAKLLKYTAIPYTGYVDFPSFKPVFADKNTQKIIVGKVRKTTKEVANHLLQHETDMFKPSKVHHNEPNMLGIAFSKIIFQNFVENYVAEPLHYTREVLRRNLRPDEDNTISVSLSYDYLPLWKGLENTDKISKKIRDKLGNKLSNAQSLNLLDARVQVPRSKIDYQCNVTLLNWNEITNSEIDLMCKLHNTDLFKNMELCAEAELSRTTSGCIHSPTIDVSSDKMRKLKAKMLYGTTCESGRQLNIQLLQKQSEKMKEKIMNSEILQQTKKELAEGNMAALNFEKVCKTVDYMDELALSLNMDPETLQDLSQSALKLLLNKLVPEMNINFSSSPLKKDMSKLESINVNIKKQPNGNMDLTLASPLVNLQVPIDDIMLPTFLENQFVLSSLATSQQNYCLLSKHTVKTFDGTVYNFKPNKCSHVLAIHPTTKNLDSSLEFMSAISTAPDDTNIAVLFEDLDKGQRQFTVFYQDKKYKLKPSNDQKLQVNGREIDFSQKQIVFLDENQDVKIIKLHPKQFLLFIESAGISVGYDFQDLSLRVSDKHSEKLRGMCGAKMSNKDLELVAPQGCILNEPENLAVLYTVTDDRCVDESVLLEKKQVEQAICSRVEHQSVDLVNLDTETDMPESTFPSTRDCNLIKTDVNLSHKGLACFSVRPILQCQPHCEADSFVEKNIEYHCDPLSPEIEDLIDRIGRGANPDMSGKTISEKMTKKIPRMCHP